MAMICAHCNSADTAAGTDSFICLQCRGRTAFDGEAIVDPAPVHLAGNYADLQRGGALVARGEGTMSDGVELPPVPADVDIEAQVAQEAADAKAEEKATAKAEKAAAKK